MGKVLLDMAISLDGFIGRLDDEDAGLYDWYFAPEDEAAFVKDELVESIGAMILGRRCFGDDPDGFDTPYKIPHFVLTHTARETIDRDGMQFIFVTDGIERALKLAQAAAGDKLVCVAGGAQTAQQFMRAGLIDEIQLHLVPILLGDGKRLFDQPGADPLHLERTRVIEGQGVTHLRFRNLRSS